MARSKRWRGHSIVPGWPNWRRCACSSLSSAYFKITGALALKYALSRRDRLERALSDEHLTKDGLATGEAFLLLHFDGMGGEVSVHARAQLILSLYQARVQINCLYRGGMAFECFKRSEQALLCSSI